MDRNLVHRSGHTRAKPAAELARQSGRDTNSIVADALFMNPEASDFRVQRSSPALKLGFRNFQMNQFGVRNANLKAIARTPQMPVLVAQPTDSPER